MKRSVQTALTVLAVVLLTAAGLAAPHAVESFMTRGAGAVQTVRVREVDVGGTLTPLELVIIMAGDYSSSASQFAASKETQRWDEVGVSSYEVSSGNRYTAETAQKQALSQVRELLKAAGLSQTLQMYDGLRPSDERGGSTCHYIVVPTYPVPRTAMLWMCDMYFEASGEAMGVILDDATGTLLAVSLMTAEDYSAGDALRRTGERFMEAYASNMGVTAVQETEASAWDTEDPPMYGELLYALRDAEGRSTRCRLTCMREEPGRALFEIGA